MSAEILIAPLTRDAFAPFGEVLAAEGPPDRLINQGLCGRYHDLATLDIVDGRPGLSVFASRARGLPYRLEMVERHPLGSQAFLPMTSDPFLVIVAPDMDGVPGVPQAFCTAPGQGINFARNTWHGVLTPLAEPGLFAVIDRIGPGDNLEEHWFERSFTVYAP